MLDKHFSGVIGFGVSPILDVRKPDVLVLLQPTAPLRTAGHIDDCLDLHEKEDSDSVVSVSEPMEHPADMVFWEEFGSMRFLLEHLIEPGITQRHGFPECFFINGLVYVFRADVFHETGSRFGGRTVPYFMAQRDSIDIDSHDDLYIAESLLLR